MQMPRRFNTYCPNCKGHYEYEVKKVRAGRSIGMKWNARQTRRDKTTIDNAGKFSKVSGGDRPTKKTHPKYTCSGCGKAYMRRS